MNTLPVRQSVSFPVVGKIRKGTPKIKQGDREIMGRDLKNKFRVEFLPGTQDVRAIWHSIYEKSYIKYPSQFVTLDGYELEKLQVMIPTRTVWDGWKWNNETYNAAGMLVARADRNHYLIKKDPLTMESIVKDGEPFTEFNPKDAIGYKRGDKEYFLPMKSSGILKLMFPMLGKFVSFELRTSSYIDSLLIDQQLAAIQQVADVLNNGIAGGIPLNIYRVEMDSPWHKGDTSRKGKQWFIQIEIDDSFAGVGISRMSQFALTGSAAAGLLQPNIPADLPAAAYVDSDDEDSESVDAESVQDDETGQVTELNIESVVPAPQRKINEIITQAAWDSLMRWVDKAKAAGISLPVYDRKKMNASTVNGASIYIQTELQKRGGNE